MTDEKRMTGQPPKLYPYGYTPFSAWRSAWVQYDMPFRYPLAYAMHQTPESELEIVEAYREQLECERLELDEDIKDVEDRIEELKKLIDEGATAASPRLGTTPFWAPTPYWPAPTPEQERKMLEQQSETLEWHIEAIKRRLKELDGGN